MIVMTEGVCKGQPLEHLLQHIRARSQLLPTLADDIDEQSALGSALMVRIALCLDAEVANEPQPTNLPPPPGRLNCKAVPANPHSKPTFFAISHTEA